MEDFLETTNFKFHLDHHTGHLRQNYAWTQKENEPIQEAQYKYKRNIANLTLMGVVYHYLIIKTVTRVDHGLAICDDNCIMMMLIIPSILICIITIVNIIVIIVVFFVMSST